jgi:type I restriction enzyme M protein
MSSDVKGEAYEGLLERNAQDIKSGAGQYFTPRPLISAIVDCMKPQPGEVIVDPACGTGGFLLATHAYLTEHSKLDRDQKKHLKFDALRGVEIVDGVSRLCAMNLFLHGAAIWLRGDPGARQAQPRLVLAARRQIEGVLADLKARVR